MKPIDAEEIMTEPLLLKVEQAAELLGLSRAKVAAMVSAGRLPSIRIDRCRRIPFTALQAWIEAQTNAQN